ncbi:hypothetical protein VIAE109791_05345 [Vibrio aestuarianus subsp. francensis]
MATFTTKKHRDSRVSNPIWAVFMPLDNFQVASLFCDDNVLSRIFLPARFNLFQ